MLHVTSCIWHKISQFWDHSWRVLCGYQPRFRTALISDIDVCEYQKWNVVKGFIDRSRVNFHILILVIFIILYAARIGYTFACHYPTLLNSLGHCICVHQGKISAAAAPPGSESTTLPMSYPGASIYSYFWRNKLVIYNFIALVLLSQHLPTFSFQPGICLPVIRRNHRWQGKLRFHKKWWSSAAHPNNNTVWCVYCGWDVFIPSHVF